jgi:N-acyl-D-amino-acid deacylase
MSDMDFIFDVVKVKSSPTYKAGAQGRPTSGIPSVIVNGTVVVRDSRVLPVKPGQPICYAVEEKVRFKPVDVNVWTRKNTISAPVLPHVDDTGAGQIHE